MKKQAVYEEKSKRDYENDIIDVEEVEGLDLKINPSYYIHLSIIGYLNALKDGVGGIALARQYVEDMEVISRAAGLLPDNYDEQIALFKQTVEYKENTDESVKSLRLANKKKYLILKEVFHNRVMTAPMKL